MSNKLFEDKNTGAIFSDCRKYRFALWRIWDESKPFIMFIGLNPSTANEDINDPTIRRVIDFAKRWDYGGMYMMNCFPFVTSKPKELAGGITTKTLTENWLRLNHIGQKCSEVIFAWGNFKEVDHKTKEYLMELFPHAKALKLNKNGSPMHPLFCKGDIKPIPFL